MEWALDPLNQVTLAHQMNDEDIPLDHGYPLRLIVPGAIGVRNCKWVCKLEISDEEAESAMQRRDYKIVKETDFNKIEWSKYPPVMGGVMFASIADPKPDQVH